MQMPIATLHALAMCHPPHVCIARGSPLVLVQQEVDTDGLEFPLKVAAKMERGQPVVTPVQTSTAPAVPGHATRHCVLLHQTNQRATHVYHFSTTSSAIQLPFIPLPSGNGCANPPTALNKFRPIPAASLTASTGAASLANTTCPAAPPPAPAPAPAPASLTSALAPEASAATCASTAGRGSHRIPRVAEVRPAEEKAEPGWEEEALTRKMAEGLVLERWPRRCQPAEGRKRWRVAP